MKIDVAKYFVVSKMEQSITRVQQNNIWSTNRGHVESEEVAGDGLP